MREPDRGRRDRTPGGSSRTRAPPSSLLLDDRDARQTALTLDPTYAPAHYALAAQFEQALNSVLAVLATAGGEARHICRMTAYCCDKPAYLGARHELGAIWRNHLAAIIRR